MPLVTNFERDASGAYLSIEQHMDGEDMPEGSTFVAFDSLAFARSTGQVAIADIACGTLTPDASLLGLEESDDRWSAWARVENGQLSVQYFGLGRAMIRALEDRGVLNPQLDESCLRVRQHVDVIRNVDYICDGAMHLTSESRYAVPTQPLALGDTATSPEGGSLTAIRLALDSGDPAN